MRHTLVEPAALLRITAAYAASEPFIARRGKMPYLGSSMRRFLSSLLLAIALIVSPLGMLGGGPGMAHPAAGAAATTSHCDESHQAPASDKEKPGMERGCAVACAALAPLGGCVVEGNSAASVGPAARAHNFLSGIGPEGETPPPRINPEI